MYRRWKLTRSRDALLQEWGRAIGSQAAFDPAEVLRRQMLNGDSPLPGPGRPSDEERVRLSRLVGASKDPRAARCLAALVKVLRPMRVVEFGTNLGLTTSYLASELPAEAQLATVDQSAERLAIARHILATLDVWNVRVFEGSFDAVGPDALAWLGGIDLAFLDGDHRLEPTLRYVEMLTSIASPGSILVLDDIRHSAEMRRAWRLLRDDERYEPTSLGDMGVLVVGDEAREAAK